MEIGNENNVKFQLYSKRQGFADIPEPKNYKEEDGSVYERDKNSKGILNKKATSIEMFNEAHAFCDSHIAIDGIDDIKLIKSIKSANRLDEKWRTLPPDYLDPSSFVFEDKENTVKANFGTGGLQALVNSRKGDNFDLVSNTSLDGKDIGEIQTVRFSPTPRTILLRSMLEHREDDFWVDMRQFTSSDSRTGNKGLPLQLKYTSDESFNAPTDGIGYSDDQNGDVAGTMYLVSNRDKRQEISMKFNFTIKDVVFALANPDIGNLNIFFRIYNNGEDMDLIHDELLLNVPVPRTKIGQSYSVSFDRIIDLKKDESWSFIIQTQRQGQNALNHNVLIGDMKGSYVFVKEHSSAPSTTSKAFTYFQMMERITAHITGENNRFRSDLLSTGKLADTLLMTGYWVRNFPNIVNEGTDEEEKIQFTTSFAEAFEDLESELPVCWFIEEEGGKEYLRIEELKYTQQKEETIRFGETTPNGFVYLEAQDVKRTVLGGNYYTKLIFGSEKGGDNFEEVEGLKSFTGKAEFQTPNIGEKEVVYSKISKYRLGSEDLELARRKQFTEYPEDSTPYDSDVIKVKAKKQGDGYVCKLWGDVYETAPQNVYDVDTAYNFELSPLHLLKNHSYVFNVGTVHKIAENIRWISSNCNSAMVTETGTEDGVVPIIELERPRVYPMTFDFKMPISQEIEDSIRGVENYPNWYGMIGVKINGEVTYCYLIKLDTNKEGKHKVIPAYL